MRFNLRERPQCRRVLDKLILESGESRRDFLQSVVDGYCYSLPRYSDGLRIQARKMLAEEDE